MILKLYNEVNCVWIIQTAIIGVKIWHAVCNTDLPKFQISPFPPFIFLSSDRIVQSCDKQIVIQTMWRVAVLSILILSIYIEMGAGKKTREKIGKNTKEKIEKNWDFTTTM